VVIFAVLQWSTPGICCGDFDGYYHIRWSRMLWEGLRSGHFPPEFRGLPLTTLGATSFADQHFLFHILLMPFTWFGSLAMGAKCAAVVFGSAAVFACGWLMWRYRLRHAWLWFGALLAASSLFLERMSMTRAQSLSLVFIVVGMFLLFERKYGWLALTGFLYVWTYNLFVVLGVMVLVWMAVTWWTERRVEGAALGWTLGGMVAGLVVNPYFPHDLRLFWEHVSAKTALTAGAGAEWYALPSWLLLLSSFVAFAAMVVGYVASGALLAKGERKKLQRPLFLLVMATLLLVATMRSKRFVEYWPATAVLFAAFAWDAARGGEDSQVSKSAKPGAPGVIAAAVVLAGCLTFQVRAARLEMHSQVGADAYRTGVEWLHTHVPENQMVFDVDWADFPKLYYYDPERAYVAGLDPMYLADANPELGRLYAQIASGQASDMGATIATKFGSHYVFASKPIPRGFYMRAMMSGEFEKIYEDGECMILKVKESVGEESGS
jgi:hypothetical protein